MDKQRNQRIECLFNAAVDLSGPEQMALLERECGSDAALKREVQKLLAAANMPTIKYLKQLHWGAGPMPHSNHGGPNHDNDDHNDDNTITDSPMQLAQLGDGSSPPGHDPSYPPPVFAPGTRILHYELIRELGRGGMGTVYLARDTKLGRRVAMKFLQNAKASLSKRFIREARVTARCNHENIIVIHDVSEHQGEPFMVLEYLKGNPLSKLLAAQTLAPGRAIQLLIPVARALVCAHEHQIVHRDLKPDNIFVTDAGTIKVLDFGVAKFTYEIQQNASLLERISTMTQSQQSELTRHGQLVGTIRYMSPEQWGADTVDHRTDIWAMGILLYRMVTGQHPLDRIGGGGQYMLTSVLDHPMPSAHDADVDMPAQVADLIDHCLRKHKDDRLSSAKKLLGALERLGPNRLASEITGDDAPYAGLAPFQEADAKRFFGRSRDISSVLARLHDVPLIGIVGPSGVGKSSFVRAGVTPALKNSGERWQVFVIRPGRQPLHALAGIVTAVINEDSSTTIADPVSHHDQVIERLYNEPGYLGTILRNRAQKHACKLLLFVDQFEELYTLTPNVRDRLAFTSSLTGVADDATSPLRVVLSLRSDFLDRVAEDKHFMAELNQGLYFLTQPNRDGLREALTRPAEMAGYKYASSRMVEHMLTALETTPAALPLLQFVAAKLWDARDTVRRLLTEHSYRDIGGMDGALASHADAVLARFTPEEQLIVREIFLQLVTPDRTRAIASLSELRELSEDQTTIQRLVDHLVDARLLVVQKAETAAGSLVEIVHESLVRGWPMLRHWLDVHHEDADFLKQLRTAARQWHERGKPPGLLWRGQAMDEARTWHRRYHRPLPPLQDAYLRAVFALADRASRIKRLLVIGTIGLLSCLVTAAAVALLLIAEAEQRANDEAAQARAAEDSVRTQLVIIQRKESELKQALARAVASEQKERLSSEELAHKNAELRRALNEAERARRKTATALVETERAKSETERLRAKDRRRLQQLEKLGVPGKSPLR